MPLFEVETTAHIMIACTNDESSARAFAVSHYPNEEIIRVTHRPRDAWVISKKLLGIHAEADPCAVAARLFGEGSRRQGSRHAALHAEYGN